MKDYIVDKGYRSSILIIYTGGTIGMKTDEKTGALVPFDFSGIYEEFPILRRLLTAASISLAIPFRFSHGKGNSIKRLVAVLP